jgi:hypothetical protein
MLAIALSQPKGLTLYPVNLDPFSYIHDLDERSFIGSDRIVDLFLISDTRPVICQRLFRVPPGVLLSAKATSRSQTLLHPAKTA